jgi:hypothetical protein
MPRQAAARHPIRDSAQSFPAFFQRDPIHAMDDSEGLPMRIVVHSAEIQDRDGVELILDKLPLARTDLGR